MTTPETNKPNPNYVTVPNGTDAGGGFEVADGRLRFFRLVVRDGKQVKEYEIESDSN